MHVSVCLDSRDRNVAEHPDPARYWIELPTRLRAVQGVRVMSAEVPISPPMIASGNTDVFLHLPTLRVVSRIPLKPADAAPAMAFFADCGKSSHVDIRPTISRLKRLPVEFRTRTGQLVDFQNADHAVTLEFLVSDFAHHVVESPAPEVDDASRNC